MRVLEQYKVCCPNVENIWLEVAKNRSKYIVGGIYRHPNQPLKDFSLKFEETLEKISAQKLPCVVAGS